MGRAPARPARLSPPALLLRAALQSDPTEVGGLAADLRPADWDRLAKLAEYHEVVPLIWPVLRRAPIPPDLAERWRAAYYLVAVRNDSRIAEITALAAELAEHSIRPVLLKGMALAPFVYQNLALRQMGDTDLLVRRADLRVAWAVLSARGYLLQPAAARYWRFQFRNSGELRLVHHRSTAMIELHWWLYAGTWAAQSGLLPAAGFWGRLREASLEGAPVLRLHPHDEALHIAFHLAVSNQFGEGVGRMLVDWDRLIRAGPPNWPRLAREARDLRLATVLWLVARVARALLGTPVPSDLAALAPSFWRRALLNRLIRPEHLLAGHDPRRTAAGRYLLLLLLFDRFRDSLGMLRRGLAELIGDRWPVVGGRWLR
ncbi:MAG TPA: nucleotidyltransferase family protein [Herpetosiphonaceae bacterium]|nr:nucleotidyltransferase family protein [Herpetosiphonaceae bacterium]